MRKNWFHIINLSAVFILLTTGASSQIAIIKGIVKSNEEALPAATVSVGNKTILTDYKGGFSIDVKPGNYLLTVTYAGYKKIEQSVSVNSGKVEFLEINMIKDEQMGEVVVLGSRSVIQRSNLKTTVPVDVISSAKLKITGQVDLTQMLNFVAPSFNTSRQIYNEPATLRGLDPDHVLILMNGTRYHNMAWLNSGVLKGQLGRGSVANDLNSIPFSAIEKIEILRDGAAAQYGSDAIAGVINIRLKESTDKTSIQFHGGQFYKGDGEKFSIGIYRGISLNKKGFLNFSGDFKFQAPTYRGGYYQGTVYTNNQVQDDSIIRARNFNRQATVSNVGNSRFTSTGFLVNGGYTIIKNTELFWTALVNDHRVFYQGAYRFPKTTNQVNTALFPNGFKVKIKPDNVDVSGIAGIKGETKNNWHWELSSSYGSNSVSNNSENTNNASQQFSLGKNAPTAFYLGKLIYKQLTNDINFAKSFAKLPGSLKSLNFGFGAECRLENYHTKEGDEASWKNYDTINRIKEGGSQGFVGISPENAVNKNRNVAGIYTDLESELNDHFLIDIAGRYEYYSDFGGNFAGKLAARYKFSDKFYFRGSVSNGFRAPSLQQRYHSSTQTVWVNSGGSAISAIRAIFSNNHEVTRAFDIPSLNAENSINISGGFTAALLNHINMTVDGYLIQIKNRIVLSGTFDRSNNEVRMILNNFPQFYVDQVQFFANAINTRTKGVDMVINGNWNISKTNFGFTLAANFIKTSLFGKIKTTDKLHADSLLFNIEEKAKLEKGQPDDKIILNLNYRKGKIGFDVRNTRFGKTATINLVRNPPDTLYEFFSPKILTDISVNYSPKTWLTVTAGVNNVFNIYPDRLKNYGNTVQGILIYSNEASPFGFNGGYYFVSMSFNF